MWEEILKETIKSSPSLTVNLAIVIIFVRLLMKVMERLQEIARSSEKTAKEGHGIISECKEVMGQTKEAMNANTAVLHATETTVREFKNDSVRLRDAVGELNLNLGVMFREKRTEKT